jgi:hypothetical protein
MAILLIFWDSPGCPKLWNSGRPEISWSSYLGLPSAGIIGMHHHTQLIFLVEKRCLKIIPGSICCLGFALNLSWFSNFLVCNYKILLVAGCQWLMPVTLATWEAEIRRIVAWCQPRQIVQETPHLQNNQSKMDWKHDSNSRVLCKNEDLSSNPIPPKRSRIKYCWW